MLIDVDEILDLIAEVGTELQLCVAATTESVNVDYGIPEERSLVCHPIRGYVIPDRFGEMQLAAQDETRSGGFIAYISGETYHAQSCQSIPIFPTKDGFMNWSIYRELNIEPL